MAETLGSRKRERAETRKPVNDGWPVMPDHRRWRRPSAALRFRNSVLPLFRASVIDPTESPHDVTVARCGSTSPSPARFPSASAGGKRQFCPAGQNSGFRPVGQNCPIGADSVAHAPGLSTLVPNTPPSTGPASFAPRVAGKVAVRRRKLLATPDPPKRPSFRPRIRVRRFCRASLAATRQSPRETLRPTEPPSRPGQGQARPGDEGRERRRPAFEEQSGRARFRRGARHLCGRIYPHAQCGPAPGGAGAPAAGGARPGGKSAGRAAAGARAG